jgi:plastocyanin
MFKLFPVLFVLFLIIGGVFSFNDFMPWGSSKTKDYKIVYTNEGYQPNFLEIPIGSKVTFENSSDLPMWTASDPHPKHTDFSVFDAKKDYQKGESYRFQFPKAGTFAFHNHEKSLHRGIIRVIDPEHPLPNIDKTLAFQLEIQEKLLGLLKPHDPSSIFTVIDTIEADGALSNDCMRNRK